MTSPKVNLSKIKELRKQNKISLEEMSKILGYESINGYYSLETGRVKYPAETLAKTAKLFQVCISDLFFEE
ncbi:helix-turn-helix domain-containing protein [Priestia flexa]|uniref:Helix-turn-helix transcriptional regulator n=1 Tax=Priestia flexa TaxID=86664 RepID=A0A8I1MCK2_9BACI|nr:helix-turn-helix transcriptional regulator [Priestia flexa]MBN8249985.1 helix-turn-helix transcriptional regulator [Priestia flexa]MBN8434693.1 helix-turn-helix transcriptional regulator [Priestia flexa]MCA0967232.1 helix-turn-helix transcriptional regulator [Priestia flexa]TYR81089.1 helix-turn-helix transcriptional regulator [Priestia megaterium]